MRLLQTNASFTYCISINYNYILKVPHNFLKQCHGIGKRMFLKKGML